jgi:hypothetical protein
LLCASTRALVFASALLVACMAARPARAYVRAVTSVGVPVWWKGPQITLDFPLAAPPPVMTAPAYLQAAQDAAAAWSSPGVACSGLVLSIRETAEASADVGMDFRNVIVMRKDDWSYSANALAMTTVFNSTKTGEIVDADIEINAIDEAWADLVGDPSLADGSHVDVQNMLTHELGHVIGLAHACWSPTDGTPRLTDNLGQTELDCSSAGLPEAIALATMFPSVSLMDTSRRTLSPDDAQAVCDVYPASTPAPPSPPGKNAGCSLAPWSLHPRARTPLFALVLTLGVLALRSSIGRRKG